jgi:RimJ/RimL family protein N-acetyltransferase
MVELAAFGRDDFERLIGWVSSAEDLMRWAGPIFQWPLDRPQLERYLAAAEGPGATRRIWRVNDGGEVVGHVELNAIERTHRSATLSRVLVRPDLRGRGTGTAMVRAALAEGFEGMGLHRVDLLVFEDNARAVACYDRLGFRREGRLRDYRRSGDRYLTSLLMSMLEDEWRAGPGRGEAPAATAAGEA